MLTGFFQPTKNIFKGTDESGEIILSLQTVKNCLAFVLQVEQVRALEPVVKVSEAGEPL